MALPKKKRAANPTTQLFKTPEEMREWSALIAKEVERWPEIRARKMFGMNTLYRGKQIFASVPDKRAFYSKYSVIFKLKTPTASQKTRLEADSRVNASGGTGGAWYGFELRSPDDIRGALEWFEEAYEAAATSGKPRMKK